MPDDATDRTSVSRVCCSNLAEKLDNRRREHSQQMAVLVGDRRRQTPQTDALQAERMPVLAHVTLSDSCEAKTAYTHNDDEARWLPRCAVSTLWTKSVSRVVYLHHHRHHHHHHHHHLFSDKPMGLKIREEKKKRLIARCSTELMDNV